jgi:hypothetical protein
LHGKLSHLPLSLTAQPRLNTFNGFTCRSQEAALTSQIDAANAELANAQQAAKVKEQDLRQLERRRDNLHQQVCVVCFGLHQVSGACSCHFDGAAAAALVQGEPAPTGVRIDFFMGLLHQVVGEWFCSFHDGASAA